MTPKMPELSHLPDSWALAKIGHFPRHLQRAVRFNWLRRRNRNLTSRKGVLDDGREAEANNYLRELVGRFPAKALELGASESQLVEYAKAKASQAEALHRDGASMEDLERFCSEHGIALPNADTDGGIKLRLACSLWWRRNLRKVNARKAEALSIALGLVHKRHALYASHDAVTRRREQKRRNRALLEALTAINELGEEFSLADVADAGMSNPRIRRAELMCRIAGFEHIAIGLELAGEFITLTAPSRFHPRVAASGQRNPHYDGVSTPTDTRDYLGGVWSRIGASLARADIKIFGFRVAEPHHDGTPHYHGLFFMAPEHVREFRRIVARHAVREDRQELGLRYALTRADAMAMARKQKAAGAKEPLTKLAEAIGWEKAFWSSKQTRWVWNGIRPRVEFKRIDWSRGTAAGYIAKYISKNIDGTRQDGFSIGQDHEAIGGRPDGDDGVTLAEDYATDAVITAQRVDAWASTWGIRQFQQVGGPPVGVWRELRRIDYADAEDVLMRAAAAADAGNWGRFVEVMGGHEASRKNMPLRLAKDSAPATNRYGEPGQKRLFGVVEVDGGQLAVTRMHTWEIKRGVGVLGRESAPWTRVNNSTETKFTPIPAQPGDAQRIAAEADEMDIYMSTRPEDDAFLPEAENRARQQRGRAAQRQFQQQISDFMKFADGWVQQAQQQAERKRADTVLRLTSQRLTKRFKRMAPAAGLEHINEIRMAALFQSQDAPRPGARWRAEGGSSKPIARQLNNAIDRARKFTARVQ